MSNSVYMCVCACVCVGLTLVADNTMCSQQF